MNLPYFLVRGKVKLTLGITKYHTIKTNPVLN